MIILTGNPTLPIPAIKFLKTWALLTKLENI